MNAELKTAIKIAYQKMNAAAEEWNKQKAFMLLEVVQNFGKQEKVIKELKEKGLPKTIYVSDDISKEVVAHLSFFAPVVRNEWFQETTIIFSWQEMSQKDYELPNICDKPSSPGKFKDVIYGET